MAKKFGWAVMLEAGAAKFDPTTLPPGWEGIEVEEEEEGVVIAITGWGRAPYDGNEKYGLEAVLEALWALALQRPWGEAARRLAVGVSRTAWQAKEVCQAVLCEEWEAPSERFPLSGGNAVPAVARLGHCRGDTAMEAVAHLVDTYRMGVHYVWNPREPDSYDVVVGIRTGYEEWWRKRWLAEAPPLEGADP